MVHCIIRGVTDYNVGKTLYVKFVLRSFFFLFFFLSEQTAQTLMKCRIIYIYTPFHLGLHCLQKTHFAVPRVK